MRILKIQFRNINSLQGNHEIDFTKPPFSQNGLFAITGATGSGKTTILDVISLALFNKIPRFGDTNISKRSIENTGSILTRGQEDAEACVVYECVRGQFQSVWRITTNRNGNLRDYEMEVFELNTGKSLVEKKSEVPAKNEELIGLKYDQFVKSIMLAQGSFAEFLKADKAHRSELLEKITGTDIYRRLGIRAFRKYRDFKNNIENLKLEKQNREQELLEKAELSELKNNQIELLKSIQQHDVEEKELIKELEVQRQILSEEKELKKAKERAEILHQKYQKFLSENGKKLLLHQQVEPFANDLNSWYYLRNEILQKKERYADLQKEISKIENKKKEFHTEICLLLKKEISSEQYENELRFFERKVVDLQREIQDIAKQYKERSNEISDEIQFFEILFDPKKPIDFKSEIEQLLASSKIKVKELEPYLDKEKVSDYEDYLMNLESQKYTLTQAQNDSRDILNVEKQLQKLTEEIQDIKMELSGLPEQIREQKHFLEIISERLKTKEQQKTHQQLLSSLDEHRLHLKEGEACPLCGALEHPYIKNMVREDIDLLSLEIQGLKDKQRNGQTLLTQLESRQENQLQLNRKLIQKKETYEREKKQKEDNFSEKFDFPFSTDWEQQMSKNEQQISVVKELQKLKKIENSVERILPKVNFLIQKQVEGKQIQREKSELYHSSQPIESCVAEYQLKWQKIKENLYALEQKQNEVQENIQQIQIKFSQTDEKLSDALKLTDIDTIQKALEILLPYDEAQRLLQIKDKLQVDCQSIENQILLQKKRLGDFLTKTEKKSPTLLEELQSNIQKKLEIERKENENIQVTLSQQKQVKAKVKMLTEQIKIQESESWHWRLLWEIMGDSEGKKFSTFAQDLTLLQLLSLANKRLQLLNQRYIITNSQENEDDNLVIIDQDMGGKRRSVKTLSGGETFIVSLALALALSDLASQNVQIKSLFIDEGFGMLDPETLDQTLDTLECLQEESSKMIGIISHVNSLKERITTQIQLQQNGRGYSTLKIVE